MESLVVPLSFLLLLPASLVSSLQVNGEVGRSITLPCSYSAPPITTMCWGRGACPTFGCISTLITTDGYKVSYQRNTRYQPKGHISRGNVSLTIENVAESDSGEYCCRVQHKGWFNDMKVTIRLNVIQPATTTRAPTTSTAPPRSTHKTAMTTSALTSTAVSTPAPPTSAYKTGMTTTPPPSSEVSNSVPLTSTHKAALTTSAPTSPKVSTSIPSTSTHMQNHKTVSTSPPTAEATETQQLTQETRTHSTSTAESPCPTDGSCTTTQSSDIVHPISQSQAMSAAESQMTVYGLYIGIIVSALVLLVLLIVITRKYFYGTRKTWTLRTVVFNGPRIQTLRFIGKGRGQAEDNVYIIKEDPHSLD